MRTNMLIGCFALALVVGFAGNAGASEDVAEEAVVNDETPYIDEDGNLDAEMAKDYAEQVDAYVDEFGIAWDVWLDELGGQMWAETTNPKALEFGAVESISLSDETSSEQQATTLVLFWFSPNYVKVWRHDLTPSTVTYTRGGSGDYITYWGSCGTRCAEWRVWATYHPVYVYYTPDNVYEIQGLANSNWDVCDSSYDGYYGVPQLGGGAVVADAQNCTYLLGQYLYYTTGWEAFDEDDDDYEVEDDLMVRWDYVLGGLNYKVKVFYGGIVPG